MNRVVTICLAVLTFLAVFSGVALAQTAAGTDGSLVDLARPVLDALLSGHPGMAAALGLVLLAALARRYGGSRIAFLNSDAGGAVLVLVTSFGGAAAAAIGGGAAWSLALAWKALGVAVSAAGGYSLVKRLIVDPILRPWAAKGPAWLGMLLSLITWVFDKPDPIAGAVADGAKAVAAKPAGGADAITGTPEDVR